MSGRPWVLAEADFTVVSATAHDVAVLPWGATEAHNLHLPYGTDVFETAAVAAEAGRIAWEAGARPLILPTVPFGANAQQIDIRGTINMHPSTQAMVLRDVVESLVLQDFTKLVVLNGHGGNDFKQMIRERQLQTPLFLSTVTWFRIPGALDAFERPGDHADESETSLMMHLHADLVRPLAEAGRGLARSWRLQAMREGWAWAPRLWTEVTADTGVGDPSLATPEKGAASFATITTKLASYLVALAAADPSRLYE